MVPNWFSSILANIAGFKCRSTTNSSATLDKMGVTDIGRKWSFISVIGLFFVMGIISAFFQGCGTRHSRKEEFRISLIGNAKRSAFSFNTHIGIPSGQ